MVNIVQLFLIQIMQFALKCGNVVIHVDVGIFRNVKGENKRETFQEPKMPSGSS